MESKISSNNILFGTHSVIEALRSGKEMDKVLVKKGLNNELFGELRHLLKFYEVPYQQVPVEKLNSITRKNHQGVIAFVSEISYHKLDQVVMNSFESGKLPLILMLDRVSDVRNFGAIARTAETAGIDAIVVPFKGAAQINSDAVKTSAGALNHIAVCREASLTESAEFLKQSGFQIVAATEKASAYMFEVNFNIPTVIIVGAEDTGISKNLLEVSDKLVKIPMYGKIASLNVSVAAAVVIYEAVRQRLTFQ